MVGEICIVGGGSSGWITALALLRNTKDIKVTLVESPDIKNIGVGEATVPYVSEQFKELLGLDEEEWMPFCDATFKTSLKFSKFNTGEEDDFFYHPFFSVADGSEDIVMDWATKYKNNPDLPLRDFWESLFVSYHMSEQEKFGRLTNVSHAHNLNADKFATYCKEISIKDGLNYVSDTVRDVKLDEFKNITHLVCDNTTIEADYFIDATGFTALLIEKVLKDKFVPITDYLLNDSAIVAQFPYDNKEEEMLPYVDCVAQSAGWTWKIPLWNRYGTGYVYSSKFLSREEAEKEFRAYIGKPDAEFRHIKMRAGYQENPWTSNCVALVLSAGFVEPLESSGLMLTIKGIRDFIDVLNNTGNCPTAVDREVYNENMVLAIGNAVDFVQAHFALTDREDTPYWKHIKYNTPVRQGLKDYLFKLRVDGVTDEKELRRGRGSFGFPLASWRCILLGQGVKDAIKETDDYDAEKTAYFINRVNQHTQKMKQTVDGLDSHFDYLKKTIYPD